MPQTTLMPAPEDTGFARALVDDPSQAAVLALPDGRHGAVIGAPGSGKTTTLARLVADRLVALADRVSPEPVERSRWQSG